MSEQIDFEGINKAALGKPRSFFQELIPGGKFRSREYIVRNPARDDKNIGSFKINYRTAAWADFAVEDKRARGGDIVSWYAYASNITQTEAAHRIAKRLGVPLYKGIGIAVGASAKSNGGSPTISTLDDLDRIEKAPQTSSWQRAN